MKNFILLPVFSLLLLGSLSGEASVVNKVRHCRHADMPFAETEIQKQRIKRTAKKEGSRWLPGTERCYFNVDGEWMQVAEITYVYDDRGNVISETDDEEDVVFRSVYAYDDFGRRISMSSFESYDGEDEEMYEDAEYAYDDIIPDFMVRKICRDFYGDEWELSNKSFEYSVERNGLNHITTLQLDLLYGDRGFTPAYRSRWTYDDHTGEAVAHSYEYYDVNATPEGWRLLNNEQYVDIVWDRTDGNMTGSIYELTEGRNRIKSCTVLYQGMPDGHIIVEYPKGDALDFVRKETGEDEEMVYRSYSLTITDDNGSYETRLTEYFDGDGNYTGKPEYESVNVTTFDSFGECVGDHAEVTENGETEVVFDEVYEYTRDSEGRVTALVTSVYDPDTDGYEMEFRYEYSDFVEVTDSGVIVMATASGITIYGNRLNATFEGKASMEIYSMQGSLMRHEEGLESISIDIASLPAGIYVARLKGLDEAVSPVRFIKK